MAINFSIDDQVRIKQGYIESTLKPNAANGKILDTARLLKLFGDKPARIVEIGNVSAFERTGAITYRYLRLVPTEPTSPAYHGGRGQILYFLNDDQANDSLELSTAYLCDVCAIEVLNNSGGAIPKFSVVRYTGFDVSTQLPAIALADATSSTNSPVMGMTEETIADGDTGSVIVSGAISGLDTSGFILNQTVYLSDTPGAISAMAGTVDSVVGRVHDVSTTGAITVKGELPSSGGISMQGATGIMGMQGDTGIGIQGVTGFGAQGDTGIQGLQGDTGIVGSQGATGVGGGGGGSGFFTDGTGTNAAVGKGTIAPLAGGENAVAQGNDSFANGDNSFASGYRVEVSGNYSAGFGGYMFVTGNRSLAVGHVNYLYGDNSLVVGNINYLYNQDSSAIIGNNNYIGPNYYGNANFTLGSFNSITGGAGGYGAGGNIAVGVSNSISYGYYSVAMGNSNQITGAAGTVGNFNVVFGDDNDALSSTHGFIAGGNLSAIDNNVGLSGTDTSRECFIHGTGVRIGRDYQKSWGSNQQNAFNSKIVRYIQTTDATLTTVRTINIQNGRAYSFRIQAVCRQPGLGGINNAASWDIPGILVYGDNIDPRVVVGGGSTAPNNSAGAASACRISVASDGALNILVQVTGVAATDYRWCLTLEFTEVFQ